MKSNILKYSLLLLMIVFSVSLSAQKDVRKNVRKGNKAYQQQKFSEAFTFYNDALTEKLGVNAEIQTSNHKKGKIVLHFDSPETLEALLSQLGVRNEY